MKMKLKNKWREIGQFVLAGVLLLIITIAVIRKSLTNIVKDSVKNSTTRKYKSPHEDVKVVFWKPWEPASIVDTVGGVTFIAYNTEDHGQYEFMLIDNPFGVEAPIDNKHELMTSLLDSSDLGLEFFPLADTSIHGKIFQHMHGIFDDPEKGLFQSEYFFYHSPAKVVTIFMFFPISTENDFPKPIPQSLKDMDQFTEVLQTPNYVAD